MEIMITTDRGPAEARRLAKERSKGKPVYVRCVWFSRSIEDASDYLFSTIARHV